MPPAKSIDSVLSLYKDHDHNYGFIVIDFEENQLRSYKQIRADIAALEREAAAVRKSESAAIVAKIRKLAEQYDLTAADIGLDAAPQVQAAVRPSAKTASKSVAKKTAARKMPTGKKARSGAGVAKYRDPKSGKTWTGFGRAPDWLASAKNREIFRIEPDGAQIGGNTGTAQADGAAAEPRAASKAARKVAVKSTAKAVSGKTASAKKSAGKPSVKRSAGAKAAAAKSKFDASVKSRAVAAQPAPAEGGQEEPPSDTTAS